VDQRGLVERARRGDHDAFAALVDLTIARLDTAARLFLRDPELARDAVQEALIRAWRDLPGLRDPDRFDAWLHPPDDQCVPRPRPASSQPSDRGRGLND
jgi:RNA polymerase sigma-70 factor (ECF subfamily)